MTWSEAAAPASPWDLVVEVKDALVNGDLLARSRLVTDITSSATVDVIVGAGTYLGRTEWERVSAAIDPLLDTYTPADVVPERLEWLARRADVYPKLAAAYVQAHRLSDGRTVEATTCYACIRDGLPADLPGLLRAGASAWEAALRKAWANRVIPLPGDGSETALDSAVVTEVGALNSLYVDNAVYSSAAGVNRYEIFNTAGLSETVQRTFTQAWLDNTGTIQEFWANLSGPLTAGEIADFKFTIQATNLVANHLSALVALQAERTQSNISTVADLAQWDQSTWEAKLSAHGVDIPTEITSSSETERRQKYARALQRLVEDGYPSLALRHRLDAEVTAPAHTDELVGFIDANPGFDIETSNISNWVTNNANAFSYATDPDQARANLEIVQRIYRIIPRLGRYDTAKALLDNGITSAADVAHYTREQFRAAFSGVLPSVDHDQDTLAHQIWDKATQAHARAIAMASTYALANNSGAMTLPLEGIGVVDFSESTTGLDSLATILGDLDYCACKHCRSVFSPAAYLADLLHFLAKRDAEAPHANALAALATHRPDIEHILLDCDNTNTLMPQIDLAIELLERKFADTLDASSPQTTWTTPELLAHPEHIETSAYSGTIKTLLHPWILPFNLGALEVRTYVEQLGLSYGELMQICQSVGAGPSDADIAGAKLGISSDQVAVIAGEVDPPSADEREFWGYEDGVDNNWVSILDGSDETEGDPGELLRRGDYELDELMALLEQTFIDPHNYDPDPEDPRIEFSWSTTCALADATIENLDAAALDRLHRFTRLQRATGLPARTLNLLIELVGGGTLNADFIVGLGHMAELHERTGLAYDELATWWSARIDALAYRTGPASLYHRRFLAAELHDPDDLAQSTYEFLPTDDYGTALVGDTNQAPTAAQLAVILSATRLSAADYATLMTITNTDFFSVTDEFQFVIFTELMRASSFMRTLGFSVEDYLTLGRFMAGISVDPFSSPSATVAYLEQIDRVHAAGFSLRELAWITRHDFAEDFDLDEAHIVQVFVELLRGLDTIGAEVASLNDPDGRATGTNLASIITDSQDLDEVMAMLGDPGAVDPQDQQDLIDAHFAGFMDADVAKQDLVTGSPIITEGPDRFNYVLRAFVNAKRRVALLVDLIAREMSLDALTAHELVFGVLDDPQETQPIAVLFLTSFATEEEIADGLSSAIQTAQFQAWARIHKAAALIRPLKIEVERLDWYSKHTGWVDLDELPLSGSDPEVTFDKVQALLQALEVRDLFETSDGYEQLEGAQDLAAAAAVLAVGTGATSEDLLALFDDYFDESPSVAAIAEFEFLLRLRDLRSAAMRAGATMSRLYAWVHPSGTLLEVANEVKAVARAGLDDGQWAKVAPKLRNQIRTPQRDALVAANLATDDSLKSRDALSQDLLIDVAMSPCAMTSRIKQAISSVQLYVHRCFIRLEADDVKLSEEDGALWSWMKNYRVWEANRKVFLYPENWISPSLRKDKTPQFEALESALVQDSLDDYRVERALSGYLEALDIVSNLEIIGIWSDNEQGPPFADVWVLGRTQSDPREYYLRHRDGANRWTPWDKVPVNVESDNVALVVRGDRLYLFWLMLQDGTSTPGGDDSKFDAKHVSVAWTERTQEGWTRVNVSERSEAIPQISGLENEPDSFRLQFWDTGEEIWLLALRMHISEGKYTTSVGVMPSAEFVYDTVAKHIVYVGSKFDESLPNNQGYLEDDHLTKTELISLGQGYLFEGQRYAKFSNVAGAGARFVQGDIPAHFFTKDPPKNNVALIHQANLWDPGPMTSLTPLIYDDRRRKYLIEPTKDKNGVGVDDDDLDPGKRGRTNDDGTIICWEPSVSNPPQAGPRREDKVRRRRDGLTIPEVYDFTGELPGLEVNLAQQYQGGGAFVLSKGYEDGVQDEAEAIVEQQITFDDNDNANDCAWLKFDPLYHPYAHELVHRLSRSGISGFYDTKENNSEYLRQLENYDAMTLDLGVNLAWLWGKAPLEEFDFRHGSGYGIYNWEIFYHTPVLIADKLTTDQRFEEAQNWLHRVFDPIRVVEGEDGPEKFWRIKPFYEQAQDLAESQIETMLGINVTWDEQLAAIQDFDRQVAEWLDNPFDPHAIARIRPGVYQRALIMQYFDNLIAWADNLFRQDTMESINEATMLYMLVALLLGERPREVPSIDVEAKSYAELAAAGLDAFSNAVIALENWALGPLDVLVILCQEPTRHGRRRVFVPIQFWYFCYPPNPKMLAYWDIIEDRLFKIRNCQNIDGVTRQLALFQPPIDPALLVQAAAAGVDLSSALAELDSGLPPYRFRHVMARAQAITGELRGLGSALLSALEKRDGEELATLRATSELSLLESIRQVRIRRINEAEASIESLRLSRDTIQHRRDYYAGLHAGHISAGEQDNLDKLEVARVHQITASVYGTVGGVLSAIPNLMVGTGAYTDWGGNHLGAVYSAIGSVYSALSNDFSHQASKALTKAQYDRRRDEWAFQRDSADLDLARIDQDIATAEIRLAIAQRELEDHDQQVENARDVEHFMTNKFTRRELYDWMVGQLSSLYFQTYQLAFDLAKRAERAYRHELAIPSETQTIIKYGYWDSLRKGLLAGERLAHDLSRLEIAYMDKDVREYELRKSVSLARISPAQLLALQESGTCDIVIPEWVFDLDHPSHYMRRIRAVHLTIPAVVGPFTSLGATLRLTSHVIRISRDPGTSYVEDTQTEDTRFIHGYGGEAIATSSAVNDAGLFQLDFRDERYLPFEYVGAVSSWTLSLPNPAIAPQFDYRTISDVIVHIDYTAREAGTDLATAALGAAATALQASTPAGVGYQLIAVHDAFPNEWEAFLSPSTTTHALTLPITPGHFPYHAQAAGFAVDRVDAYLIPTRDVSGSTTGMAVDLIDDALADPPPSPMSETFAASSHAPVVVASFSPVSAIDAQSWRMEIDTTQTTVPAGFDPQTTGLIDPDTVAGMILIIHYKLD